MRDPQPGHPQRRAAGPQPLPSIVLVGPLPPPPGGMANQTRQLASLLGREGCDVRVVQNNAAYRPAWIASIRGLRAFARLLPYVARLWRSIDGHRIVHVMANSGWAWHLFAAPAIWVAAWHGAPVVVNYRGGNAEAFLARELRWLRPTFKRAALVVVPSGFLAAVFARYDIPTTIVPNVVDLDAFRPASALPSEPSIIVTRNLEAIYGVATVIRAFAQVVRRHPAARLTIAGSGPEQVSLEALVRELDVEERVFFAGRIDNADLPRLYRSASVFVNASRVDNMPISILEALASGVPVVSTDAGGIPYLVQHGKTALLVPPDQPDALAAAVLRVIEDPALALGLRSEGLSAVRQYAWPSVRDRLFEAYECAAVSRRERGVPA